MSDLDIKLEKATKLENWTKAKKMELSVPGVVYYFNYKYFNETGEFYPIKQMNWHNVGNIIKKHILDEWTERGFGVEELKEFIDWVFTNKKPEHWSIKALKHQVSDWIKQRAVKQRKVKGVLAENVRAKRLEEEQFAKYLGEGYFDNQLTKMQYWLGLVWRKKYVTGDKLVELKKWQEANFSPEDIGQLLEWRKEWREAPFDAKKQFYIELCKVKKTKLESLLYEFGRGEYYRLYTTEELKKEWT